MTCIYLRMKATGGKSASSYPMVCTADSLLTQDCSHVKLVYLVTITHQQLSTLTQKDALIIVL